MDFSPISTVGICIILYTFLFQCIEVNGKRYDSIMKSTAYRIVKNEKWNRKLFDAFFFLPRHGIWNAEMMWLVQSASKPLKLIPYLRCLLFVCVFLFLAINQSNKIIMFYINDYKVWCCFTSHDVPFSSHLVSYLCGSVSIGKCMRRDMNFVRISQHVHK